MTQIMEILKKKDNDFKQFSDNNNHSGDNPKKFRNNPKAISDNNNWFSDDNQNDLGTSADVPLDPAAVLMMTLVLEKTEKI